MAFVSLIKYYATSTTDALDKFKDTLVSAGWTLHDDLSGASPYGYVLTSTGEAGTDWPIYLYMYKGTNIITFTNYVYWDNSTHTGNIAIASYYYCKITTRDSASFYIWCAATKDNAVFDAYVSQQQAVWFGLVDPISSTLPLGTLQSGVSSGSNVVLTLASGETDNFVAGSSYQILDNNNRNWVEVNSINSGSNQITITTLSYDFSLGAIIGTLPLRWAVYVPHSNNYCFTLRHDVNGSANQGAYDYGNAQNFITPAVADPDARSQKYPMWPIGIGDYNNVGIAGIIPVNQYTIWLRCYINTNIELPMSVGNLDTGTSSGSNTTTTLNDTTKSWATDIFVDKILIITGGLGSGQFRSIASNTGTELTISSTFDTTPNDTSEYTVCEEGWQYLYVGSNSAYSGAMRVI